jgi:hypothetical protein
MTGLDPLADLQPNPPRTAEKKARLIALADSILAARMRRVSLAKIAGRLDVSPDYLSQVMAEHHGAAWTNDTNRRSDEAKGKKKAKARTRGTGKVTAETTGEGTGQLADPERDALPSSDAGAITDRKPVNATKSRFHSMRGQSS